MAASIIREATALCSPCKRNKEEVHAVFWCNSCNEGLCPECSNHHTRNKASAHHKVLSLSYIQSELLLLDRLDIKTQCEPHPDNQKTVYCEDDDVFCCTVCSSTDHRRCNNVQSIDRAAKAYTSGIREIDIQGINTLVVLVDIEIEKRIKSIKETKLNSTEFLRNVQAKFDMAMKELQRKRTSAEGDIKEAEKKVSRINTSGWSEYPALSHDGKMLYHGDGLNNVVCRNMEDVTQELWRYSSQELLRPLGICTDRDGNILIVGGVSKNVHQVSKDENLNRIIVNKMKYIKEPCGLFTNRNNNTFCVTSSLIDKVCVEMYRLENSFKAKLPPNTPKQK